MTEEQKDLVVRNYGMIYGFMDEKAAGAFFGEDDVKDFLGILEERMCRCAVSFGPGYGCTFASYVYRCFESEYRHYLKQIHGEGSQAEARNRSAEETVDRNGDSAENTWDLRVNEKKTAPAASVLSGLYADLSETEKSVVFLLKNGYTQAKAAQVLEISRTEVSRIREKVHRRFLLSQS